MVKYGDKEIECRFCHYKAKPILKLNRVKADFVGVKYTGKEKGYWLICQKCKKIIGSK